MFYKIQNESNLRMDESMKMDEFECVEYPPKLPESIDIRGDSCTGRRRNSKPITAEYFNTYFDEEGRITNEYQLRKDVFTSK